MTDKKVSKDFGSRLYYGYFVLLFVAVIIICLWQIVSFLCIIDVPNIIKKTIAFIFSLAMLPSVYIIILLIKAKKIMQ